MLYNHVAFNSEWVASKKFSEFVEHEKHHGFTPEQMKDIYSLCKAESKSLNAQGSTEEPYKETGI